MFTGQVAVVTNFADQPTKPSVMIWDLTNQTGAPLGSQWDSNDSPPTHQYFQSGWARSVIGDVFGVTLDRNGNIYVAATRVYGTGNVGAGGGYGDIYKIDGNTGAVTRFVQTINSPTYQTSNPNKIPNTGAGLGNINYSCEYDSLYVANLEDGLIYRINMAGQIVNRYNHGSNFSLADNAAPGATQFGRRPFAVQVKGPELLYSLWNEDQGRPDAAKANEIWSVALNGSGDPTGAPTLRISVPAYSGIYSNPVTDISVSTGGNILLSERSMTSDTSPGAHQSRALEYTGAWSPMAVNKFQVGALNNGKNSAGGGDYDSLTGGRVWNSGDALTFTTNNFTYGIQGLPTGGGNPANSILIDDDNDITSQDKTQIGDVEIPCPRCEPPPKPQISGPDSTCAPGQYCVKMAAGVTYTWNVTGGVIQGPSNGGCITVNWGANPGKSITVTTTNAAGCTSTTTLNLKDCDILHQGECCLEFQSKADLKSLIYQGNGVYNFTANLSASSSPIVRVTANIVSSSLTYSAPSCGTAGPVNAYVLSAGNVPGFTASVPVANGHEVIWYGNGANVGGQDFPIQIKFPPPPGNPHCKDYLTFCVKYTFTDRNCHTCEVIRCYGPFPRSGGIDIKNVDMKSLDPQP